jgi:hypothetical protein
MMAVKISKNSKVLVLDFLNIEDSNNILNNLPNGIEYLHITSLMVYNYNNITSSIINNLPMTIKKVSINILLVGKTLGMTFYAKGNDEKDGLEIINKLFKFPYECKYSFGNPTFDKSISNKKFIQVLYAPDHSGRVKTFEKICKNEFSIEKTKTENILKVNSKKFTIC